MTPEAIVAAMITALLSYDEPVRLPTAKPARKTAKRHPKPRKTRTIDKPSIKNLEPITAEELLISARDGIRGEEPPDTSDIDEVFSTLRKQFPASDKYNKDDDNRSEAQPWVAP